MSLKKPKHEYAIVINSGSKRGSRFIYRYGGTDGITIVLAKGNAAVSFGMTVLKRPEDFMTADFMLFRDAMRKIYLLHAVLFDSALEIGRITLSIDGEETVFDRTTPHFPFVFSMLTGSELSLGRICGCPEIVDAVLESTKSGSENDLKQCALQAYLLSKSRQFETDRFMNLWTSMNAFYGEIAIRAEEAISRRTDTARKDLQSKYRLYKLDNPSIGALIRLIQPGFVFPRKPDDIPEYRKAYRLIGRSLAAIGDLDIDELYDEAFGSKDNDPGKTKNKPLYEAAAPLGISLYVFLLLVYPYWLRCSYFHGSRVQPVVAAYSDPELLDLSVVNGFLDRFLSDNIPGLFGSGELTESETDSILQYLKER